MTYNQSYMVRHRSKVECQKLLIFLCQKAGTIYSIQFRANYEIWKFMLVIIWWWLSKPTYCCPNLRSQMRHSLIPKCTISLQDGELLDICLIHCGIWEIDLLCTDVFNCAQLPCRDRNCYKEGIDLFRLRSCIYLYKWHWSVSLELEIQDSIQSYIPPCTVLICFVLLWFWDRKSSI